MNSATMQDELVMNIAAEIDLLMDAFDGDKTRLAEKVGSKLRTLVFSHPYREVLGKMLMNPVCSFAADDLLARIKHDIPALSPLNDDQLAIRVEQGPDQEVRTVFLTLGAFPVVLGSPVSSIHEVRNLDVHDVDAATQEIAAAIEGFIQSASDSKVLCRQVGEQLATLISGQGYESILASLRANPLSDLYALALIDRIKRDVPVLEPLNYGQMGVYVRQRTESFVDLSALYLAFGDTTIELGTPTCTTPANTTLN